LPQDISVRCRRPSIPPRSIKSAILSYIFHFAIKLGTDFDLLKEFVSLFNCFIFEDLLAGEDYVAVFFVYIHDLESEFLAMNWSRFGMGLMDIWEPGKRLQYPEHQLSSHL
jgi:hypothetical protein